MSAANLPLGLGVDRAGRLVEHEDRRIGQERAGDREPLLLAARESRPAFPEQRLVGRRLPAEEVVGPGRLGGREPRFDRRLGPAVGEVFPDRAAKQERLLKHDSQPLPQLAGRQPADVDPVDLDAPLLDVVEPGQEVHERGFSGAAAAHDPDHLAGGHLEGDVVEHRLVFVVAEGHVAKGDPPRGLVPGGRLGRLGNQGWRVEQLEHPLATREKARQPRREARKRAHSGA